MCVLEAFWLEGLGWLAWYAPWGYGQPSRAVLAIVIVIASVPAAAAIAFGILGVKSKYSSVNRILGALGVCGGVGWLCVLFWHGLFGL